MTTHIINSIEYYQNIIENLNFPPDMSSYEISILRKYVKTCPGILSEELIRTAFLYYTLGNTYKEIAEKISMSREIVLLTSIVQEFYKKRYESNISNNSEIVRNELTSLGNNLLAVTSAVIERDLKNILKGEEGKFFKIPSNIVELEKFVNVISKIHNLGINSNDNNQNNVNVVVNTMNNPVINQPKQEKVTVVNEEKNQELAEKSETITEKEALLQSLINKGVTI